MPGDLLIADERPFVTTVPVAFGSGNQVLLQLVDNRVVAVGPVIQKSGRRVTHVERNTILRLPLHVRQRYLPSEAEASVGPTAIIAEAQRRSMTRGSGRQLEIDSVLGRPRIQGRLKGLPQTFNGARPARKRDRVGRDPALVRRADEGRDDQTQPESPKETLLHLFLHLQAIIERSALDGRPILKQSSGGQSDVLSSRVVAHLPIPEQGRLRDTCCPHARHAQEQDDHCEDPRHSD